MALLVFMSSMDINILLSHDYIHQLKTGIHKLPALPKLQTNFLQHYYFRSNTSLSLPLAHTPENHYPCAIFLQEAAT